MAPPKGPRMNANGMRTAQPPNALIWLTISALVIALDQSSKYWVLTALPEHTAVPVIEGVWNWYRSYNTGAAFSFLSGAGGWQQGFFGILALAVCGLLAKALATILRTARPSSPTHSAAQRSNPAAVGNLAMAG